MLWLSGSTRSPCRPINAHRSSRRSRLRLGYPFRPSLDGRDEFSFRPAFEPLGDEPVLGPARPDSAAQVEQMQEPPVTNALT